MHDQRQAAGKAAADWWKTALLWTAALVAALILVAAQTDSPIIEHRPDIAMAMYLALKQDLPVGGGMIALLLALRFLPDRADAGRLGWQSPGKVTTGTVIFLPAVIALALQLWVFPSYDMTRDEQMATFDAAIYARGHLFETIPVFWRDYYNALNSTFLLPIGNHEGWVSNYLPGNALIRAALPPLVAGPALVLVASLALWRISLKIWPTSASTRLVVMLLFACSSQLIVTGTTAYAMTAHLALNLVWLALFLRRTPSGHAGAILVGLVATGLHQPIFHPLFVAPFLLLLLLEKRWKELAAYVLCYGAIGLFWLGWQPWVSAHGVGIPPEVQGQGGVSPIERLLRVVALPTRWSFILMGANLLRLATWNNLLLLPLAGLGMWSCRGDRLVQALFLGIALMLLMLVVVMPAQTEGWGYRYLHGYLGSIALLAGFGWNRLEHEGAAPVRALAAAAIAALALSLPIQVHMAQGQRWAYARTAHAIRAIDADIAIVDEGVPFAENLVFNRADLSNRPILLAARYLMPEHISALCGRGTVAFVDAPQMAPISRFFKISPPAAPTPKQLPLKAAAVAAHCRIVPSTASIGAGATAQ